MIFHKQIPTYNLGENVRASELRRRESNSSLIVVTADEIQDSGIVSSFSSDDISSEGTESSRLKYLLWPIVKLMTLLRFWRRPKDGESDEEFDKSEASQSNTDTSMEIKGKEGFRFYPS